MLLNNKMELFNYIARNEKQIQGLNKRVNVATSHLNFVRNENKALKTNIRRHIQERRRIELGETYRGGPQGFP